MNKRIFLNTVAGLALLASCFTTTAWAIDPDAALKELAKTVLSKGPNGEDPVAASAVTLTDDEIAKVKAMHATAALVFHVGGNDWTNAQTIGLKSEFEKLGIDWRLIAIQIINFGIAGIRTAGSIFQT